MACLTERRRVLHLHPHRADVLVERIEGECQQFSFFCQRHQRVGPSVLRVEDVGTCAECVADATARPDRARYAGLHGANVRIERWR